MWNQSIKPHTLQGSTVVCSNNPGMQYFDSETEFLPCLIEGLNNDIASSSCDNTVTLDDPSSTCKQYYILGLSI